MKRTVSMRQNFLKSAKKIHEKNPYTTEDMSWKKLNHKKSSQKNFEILLETYWGEEFPKTWKN